MIGNTVEQGRRQEGYTRSVVPVPKELSNPLE